MKIRAYLKAGCCWSDGVRAALRKYALDFEEIDVAKSPESLAALAQVSGGATVPCVEIDGVFLSDVSGEEVENFLLSNHLVSVDTNHTDQKSARDSSPLAPRTVRFF